MVGTIPTADGPIDAPSRLLVVVAHPDDIDFGTAGTMAALTKAGTHVEYCLVTSGDAGDDDLTRSSEELAAEREAEQTAAAHAVGVEDIHWLRHPDGMVVADLALRRDIARVIRMVRPDVVVSQATEPNWDRIYGAHPDHLATAQATMAAVYPDSRNPRAFPVLLDEGYEPHKVTEVWMTGQNPNRYVDITDTFPQKVEALRSHVSQTARMENLEGLLREWSGRTAESAGMPEGRLAEGYRVISAG
jgi:LmbE family N-acetylglucosaminyl deacetylase